MSLSTVCGGGKGDDEMRVVLTMWGRWTWRSGMEEEKRRYIHNALEAAIRRCELTERKVQLVQAKPCSVA
jgi:hypothetical protein